MKAVMLALLKVNACALLRLTLVEARRQEQALARFCTHKGDSQEARTLIPSM
jgi:hypothetical protein